ncbi:hypothetical protein JHK82_042106 [Glycine max]|nr:hypothetical protein JHK85_042775 [Glycine max]KAG5105136.1 hypothetical protein JHK82_042106 [Glycine max]
MERRKNKRAREDDGVEIESSFENYNNNIAKKEKNEVEEKDCSKAWDYSHLTMGVFDFPWMKDGVISKSYECLDFEDDSWSSLERQETLFKASEASMAHIQEAKLVEDMWKPFESNGLELEAEDGDCIWSFLLNKPL